MKSITWQYTGWILAVLTGISATVFLLFPGIDIRVSAIFTDQENLFYLRTHPVLDSLRFLFMYGVDLFAIVCLALLIRSASIGSRRKIPLDVWGFTVSSFIVAPVVLVNGIVKSHWGRARPADIEYFGGAAEFSPPLLISDQCTSNCSFVSGEGSGIATSVIVLWVLLWPNMNRLARHIFAFIFLPFVTFGISLRIVTGRHFLSDTIFAVLLCAIVIWALYRLFNMSEHRNSVTWQALREDLSKKK